MRNGIAAFVVLIVVAAAAPAGFAQESFEVASVKKHLPDDTALGGVRVLPGRRFDIRGLPLRALVFLAYGSDSIVAPTQVVDGPAWVDADMFDVSAKGAGVLSDANGFTPHLVAMIRALLTERFALRVHPAKRELPVYELVRARPSGVLGPRLITSKTMCPTPSEAALPASPERWCATFDMGKNITYRGVVEEYRWQNPRSHVVRVAAGAADRPTVGTWTVEASDISVMTSSGWTPKTYKPGDPITVVTHPNMDGSNLVLLF